MAVAIMKEQKQTYHGAGSINESKELKVNFSE